MEFSSWLFIFLIVILISLILNLRLWFIDRLRARNLIAKSKHIPLLFTDTGPAPRISFLAAAWNEEANIQHFIESILELSYPNYELILCAGGSDNTYRLACQYQSEKIIVLEQQNGEGKQHSLQRCFEKSTGEIIYLIDADCRIDNTVFAWMLAPILNEGEEVVSGSLYTPLPEQMENPFVLHQYATHAYAASSQPKYGSGLLGGNCAIRRKALVEAGAFRTTVKTGTDYDLAKRLLQKGNCIRFEVNATIQSEFPTKVQAYFNRQTRWVKNVVIHGMRFRAYGEVAACFRTSIIGLCMLLTPFICLALVFSSGFLSSLGLGLLTIWICAFVFAFCSRLRYLRFARIWPGFRLPQFILPALLILIWIDFIAWSIPFLEYGVKPLREKW